MSQAAVAFDESAAPPINLRNLIWVALAFAVQLAFTRLLVLLRQRREQRAPVHVHAHLLAHDPDRPHEPEHAVRGAPAQP